MDELAVLITGLVMAMLLQWPAAWVCHRNEPLMPWRGVLSLSALLWACMPAIQVFVLIKSMRGDWIMHEQIAREIADSLLRSNFANIGEHFSYGNPGYRFLFGLFYAVTGAPSIAPYAINGALGFWGMVTLLHVICRQTGCQRVPLWLILITAFLPSALFWTPMNLKEGICFWGICMMLRGTLRDPRTGARESRLLPLLGFVATAFVRPHMGMAFAIAIGLGSLVNEKKLRHVVVIGASVLIGFQVLQVVRPQVVEGFTEEGVLDTLDAGYEAAMGTGGSAIYHPGGRPIPVVTGLTLIFLRPFPHEINGVAGAMAALEIWFITALCVTGWMKMPSKKQILLDPFTMTLLAATLFMAFFFSYMYNMGLMVRQRLHVLPAVIALAAIPHLLPGRGLPVSGGDLAGHRQEGHPRSVVPPSRDRWSPPRSNAPEAPAPVSSGPTSARQSPGTPGENFP